LSKNFILTSAIFLATAALSQADSIVVGTAGNSALSTPSKPSPNVGPIISFSGLADGSPVASVSTGGATISSPDQVQVIPYSSMYNTPNEIFDASSKGTANLTVKLTSGTNEIGVGVADSDGVSITLQALNASGTAFGSIFTENLGTTADANGDSYFAIADTGYDIYGFQILQTTGNANYSGLAIGDLEVAPAPEPASFALLGASLALFGGLRLRRKKA
jgi:hypothetical protein